MAKGRRKRQQGVVVPKEIAYAVILSLLAGSWSAYQQLQRIDQALEELQEEVKVLVERGTQKQAPVTKELLK